MTNENLEEKVDDLPNFDLSPSSQQDIDTAEIHNIRYERKPRRYVDSEGYFIRDKFGQLI